ncbi:MAG: class I SAM-dependent methyltransferase [Flavobacteriales bacterium]
MRWQLAQWFEKRWWKRYLSEKSPDVYIAWKRKYWMDFLEKIDVHLKIEDRILDAGCGPAGIFIALDQSVTAVDPLLAEYQMLPHFMPANFQNVRFIQSTIENYKSDTSNDVIFCLNVINHVKHYDHALDNMVLGLKHGGTLVISIDCHNFSLPKWLFRFLPLDILHPHQYSLSEYESHIVNRGIRLLNKVKIKSGFLFDYYALVGEKA